MEFPKMSHWKFQVLRKHTFDVHLSHPFTTFILGIHNFLGFSDVFTDCFMERFKKD